MLDTSIKYFYSKETGVKVLMENLTYKEMGYLVFMSANMNSRGILLLTPKAREPVYRIEDFQKLLGLTKKIYAADILKKFIELRVLINDTTIRNKKEYPCYKVSRKFFFKGSIPANHQGMVTRFYVNSMQEIYKGEGAGKLGWLVTALTLNKCTSMTCREFADLTGISKRVVQRYVASMTLWDEILFQKVGSDRYKVSNLVADRSETIHSRLLECCTTEISLTELPY